MPKMHGFFSPEFRDVWYTHAIIDVELKKIQL